MPLTTAQLQTLKTDIAANTNTVSVDGAAPVAINSITGAQQTADAAFAIAAWYSQAASPTYFVVCTNVSVQDINNAIDLSKYTPNPAVNSTNAAQGSQAANYAMVKQENLRKLTERPSQTTFDASRATNVKSLKDAVTNLPCGASFALVDAGWGTVPTGGVWALMSRAALNIEKLYANVAGQAASTLVPTIYDGTSAQGAQGNPSVMLFEGTISYTDVQQAWNS